MKKFNKNKKNTRRTGKTKNKMWNFTSNNYETSEKPQTYGPGRTVRIIDIDKEIQGENDYIQNIGTLLKNNIEMNVELNNYNYWKLLNFAIVFYPNDYRYNNSPIQYFKFQVNWENSTDVANINTEDNSKLVPVYRTKKYCYKFIPVNITYLVGNASTSTVSTLSIINPREYARTYIPLEYYPGKIIFGSSTPVLQYKILMKIEYRGSKIPDLNRMIGRLDRLKKDIEEEEKSRSGKITEVNRETVFDEESL
jgi:hypothetical protein